MKDLKKYSVLILLFVLILFYGCSQQKEIDAFGFAERFEKLQGQLVVSDGILTDGDSAMLFVNDAESNEILISLFQAEKSQEIIGLSVTAAELNESAHKSFVLAVEAAINAFCTNEKENTADIIKSLKVADKPKSGVALEIYRTVYYEYTFQINEAGADLTVINRFSAPETESELTLREKDDLNNYTKTY